MNWGSVLPAKPNLVYLQLHTHNEHPLTHNLHMGRAHETHPVPLSMTQAGMRNSDIFAPRVQLRTETLPGTAFPKDGCTKWTAYCACAPPTLYHASFVCIHSSDDFNATRIVTKYVLTV